MDLAGPGYVAGFFVEEGVGGFGFLEKRGVGGLSPEVLQVVGDEFGVGGWRCPVLEIFGHEEGGGLSREVGGRDAAEGGVELGEVPAFAAGVADDGGVFAVGCVSDEFEAFVGVDGGLRIERRPCATSCRRGADAECRAGAFAENDGADVGDFKGAFFEDFAGALEDGDGGFFVGGGPCGVRQAAVATSRRLYLRGGGVDDEERRVVGEELSQGKHGGEGER